MATARLKTKTIKARPGARISDAEAKRIAPELFAIEQQLGCVTPEEVLRRAENPRNPLHKHIEWDNSKAADTYRIDQARTVIRSVVYEIEVIGTPSKPVRKFQPVMINVRSSAEDEENPMQSGYVSVTRALSDAGMRVKILEQAAKELDAWKRRYNTLELLTASIRVVTRTVRKIRARAAKLRKTHRKEARRAA